MSLEELDESISRNSRDAAKHFFRAARLASTGHISDALEALKLAAELAPRLTELHMAIGYAHQGLGNHEEALREFEAILDHCPQRVDALCAKGEVLAAQLRMVDSLETMDLAARIDPCSSVAHKGKGIAQRMLEWDDYGLAALKRATALDPKNSHVRAEAGLALMLQDRDREAMHEYDEAIRIDRNDVYARVLKCIALHKSGRYGDALEEVERILSIDRGNQACRITKALSLFALDRKDEALADLYDVVDKHPEIEQTRLVLGLVLAMLERNDEALEHLDRIVSANPENDMAHLARIEVLWELQRTEEGDRALDAALALHPHVAIFCAYKGHICRATGRSGDARRFFARAHELDPALDIQKAGERASRG